MADKVRVNVLKQKVFHDGLSMIVLKPGREKVDPAHLQTLFDEGIIADPGKEALRRAAALSGFTDAGELKGPGDDTFSQPIGAFTEEQERNLAEQSQLLAGDDADDVEALRDRIEELVVERDDLRQQILDMQQTATIKGEVVEGGAPLSLGTLVDNEGNPVSPPAGDINDPPSELDLTEEQRAHLPQLDHDGDGLPGGSEAYVPPALTGKNKAELLAIAADEEVTIPEGATNAEIVKLIEEARDAYDAGEAPPA